MVSKVTVTHDLNQDKHVKARLFSIMKITTKQKFTTIFTKYTLEAW